MRKPGPRPSGFLLLIVEVEIKIAPRNLLGAVFILRARWCTKPALMQRIGVHLSRIFFDGSALLRVSGARRAFIWLVLEHGFQLQFDNARNGWPGTGEVSRQPGGEEEPRPTASATIVSKHLATLSITDSPPAVHLSGGCA